MKIRTKRRAGPPNKKIKHFSLILLWFSGRNGIISTEQWGRARLSRVWNVESSAQHHQSVIYQSAVGADEGNNRIMQWWLHLQTKVPEDCAKTSQSRRRPQLASWLKAPTSTFTFKTLWRHYAKQMPKHWPSWGLLWTAFLHSTRLWNPMNRLQL